MKRKSTKKRFLTLRQSKIGFRCPICGATMGETLPFTEISVTIEHVKPLGDGGLDVIQNIEIICLACNSARNYVKIYFKNKSTTVPVEYWQISLTRELSHLVDEYYSVYHEIFLEARFGLN